MTQRYTFTIRPPSSFHCPPGWVPDSMVTRDPPARFDHGTVDYPEPLDIKVADHWSLIPVGPRVTAVYVDGTMYDISNVWGAEAEVFAYRLAVGQMTAAEAHEAARAKGAEYEVTIELEIDRQGEGT